MKYLPLLILSVLLAACSKADTLPEIQLEALGGGMGAPLNECNADKCVTIVIAPWCGVCQIIAPRILKLRDHLTGKQIETHIVAAYAELDRLKAFAKPYGDQAMLDPDGKASPQQTALPLFIVTEKGGKINKRTYGLPSGPDTPEALTEAIGL